MADDDSSVHSVQLTLIVQQACPQQSYQYHQSWADFPKLWLGG